MPAIYLDHAATTPVDPRVFEIMRPYFLEHFGNAASRQHRMGREAGEAVERARAQVAAAIGADPREIVFTSGATEADNLALKGVVQAEAYVREPRHVITCTTEHRAVLDPLRALEEEGLRVTRLGVDTMGHLDPAALEAALKEGALLVSIMLGNNETGVLHPMAEIGAMCRAHGVLLHTDATQALGKLPIAVDEMFVDLLSLSAHKFGGPKGVGALYLRRKRPRVRCHPLMDGGGHERGLRSGTLNVPGIMGLGAAAELRACEPQAEARRMAGLRDRLERGLAQRLEGIRVNGDPHQRLPNISNLSFDGVSAESLLESLSEVQASSSSACTSASLQPSHVLRSMSLGEQRIEGSVRFSLGFTTTADEIEAAIDDLAGGVERVGRARPPG